MVPTLVDEIPTVENGGVAPDLRSITWRLTKNITWSNGTPLTAHDVAFTGQYCLDEAGGCNSRSYFNDVTQIEALDDRTVKVHFGVAKPFPYGPFVGSTAPILQKTQFKDCMGARAQECTEQNFGPIGTGPFKVEEFRANDVITLSANESYRDPDKPAFATATFKGGGDPASPDTYMKFYADIEMYTNNFSGTDPESYMANWTCSEIPGPDNQWLGKNIPRACAAEYDVLVSEMSQTGVPRRMRQRHEHLPATPTMLTNVVLHDRVPTGESVLVTKTLEDALRRGPLLPMAVAAIVLEPLLDQSGKLVELRSAHRRCASVARRNRKLKHLPHALA